MKTLLLSNQIKRTTAYILYLESEINSTYLINQRHLALEKSICKIKVKINVKTLVRINRSNLINTRLVSHFKFTNYMVTIALRNGQTITPSCHLTQSVLNSLTTINNITGLERDSTTSNAIYNFGGTFNNTACAQSIIKQGKLRVFSVQASTPWVKHLCLADCGREDSFIVNKLIISVNIQKYRAQFSITSNAKLELHNYYCFKGGEEVALT